MICVANFNFYTNRQKKFQKKSSKMKNSCSNQEDLRKRVYAFMNLNLDTEKNFIANHFIMEGHPKSTIYDIIKRQESSKPAERKVGSGKPAKIMTKKAIKRLKNRINHKDGVSQRRLGQIF